MIDLEPTFIDVAVPGGTLAVARWGAGENAVIAAHGLTASSVSWLPVVRQLDPGFTMLAPDLRGRGASAAVEGPWGMARHADDVLAIADQLGIRSAVLTGESMGAYVVALAAFKRPGFASRVVLVDGGLPLPFPADVDPDVVIAATLGPALARLSKTFPSVEAYFDFWRQHPALADVWNDDVEAYLRYDLVGDAPELRPAAVEEAVRADARDLFDTGQIVAALRGVTCPVIHLRAERGIDDQPPGLQPAVLVEEWAPQIADFTSVTVPDTNHYTIAFGEAGAREIATRMR